MAQKNPTCLQAGVDYIHSLELWQYMHTTMRIVSLFLFRSPQDTSDIADVQVLSKVFVMYVQKSIMGKPEQIMTSLQHTS